MLFPTLTFGLFFLAVYAIAWGLKGSNEWRKIFLLVASWFFYGAWDWRFVALLIVSGFLNWGAARLIIYFEDDRKRRKLFLILGVIANLCILGWFKYYGFFMEQFAALLSGLGWERDLYIMQVVLPIGISFFTFQGMSYLIDIYRRQTEPARLLDMVLLMSFFPHLVAGPIVRASHLIPQFQSVPKMDRGMAAMGLLLIVWGLFKKAVIASYLATEFVDPVFFDPAAHSSLDLMLAAYGYAVQIYCDFSAYSDMAIGLAALLGYRFPHNFNQPYRAASLQDFWRRWHISLSSWLRDYLYISLGGSRHGQLRLYAALMTTMLLGGLWHGASWNFVIWGGIHGGVLVAERLWRQHKPEHWPALPQWAGIILTFHIVTLAWIFFRSSTSEGAMQFLSGIGALDFSGSILRPMGLFLILLGTALHALPPDAIQKNAMRLRRINAAWVGLGLGILILVIDAMRPAGVEPFIYYQF
ncbi:MBOAT family O-acyltransferase [Parasphingopyxis marina]|uniref:Probable alginate O-acetylase AlgI n=1 Tax=Parasphingopyxis marina TaxID=2761622 RepID=A0A842HV38_9SPHN|nr:MBOAT family protein [Parasphingopyxis marina]MBC2776832.1 MBOAT family protein [Parasphingopyxis marina]